MDGGDKTIWIIANWKSNMTISEGLDWISKVGPNISQQDNLKVVVCPTFSCLSEIKKTIQVNSFPIMVGAQNLSPFGIGAYTGEESAALLKDLVDLSILGHSERRENFGEDDGTVVNKVKQSLDNNIIPLICVQGKTTPVPDGCKLVAYEPVFAIGTGTPDTPENANEAAEFLKKDHEDLQVLYGGSVDAGNVASFLAQVNISGVLVGKASLDAEEFIRIVNESH